MTSTFRICCALIVLLLAVGTGIGQDSKPHFHGTAPGHKVDYHGRFADAVELSESAEGQAVMAGLLAAYGGVEKLKTLQGFRIRYVDATETDDKAQDMVKSFKRGRHYRTVEGKDSRVLNNLTCWYEHEDQTAELNDTRYRAELFSYLALGMPLVAETERFDSIRYGQIDGDPLGYLYFEKADSVLVEVAVSPEDHFIAKTTGILPQGNTEFIFSIEYADHQSYEGYIFPRKAVFYSLGMRVGDTEIGKIEINPQFGGREFLPRNGDM